MNRRTVLKSLALTAGVATLGSQLDGIASAMEPMQAGVPTSTGPFMLPPLPYAYDALEPYIDAETMHLHHDKHHASYVNNLNAAVAGRADLAKKSVDQLITDLNAVPEEIRTAVRNQGGGHANHSFFWKILSHQGGTAPKAELARDIDAQFGSVDKFQQQFIKAAASVFGSGWAWLSLSRAATLQIETTGNQDSPLSHGNTPILGIDVWEHAYYLKYQNRRPEYITAFFHAVNWDYISSQYPAQKSACNPEVPCKVSGPLDGAKPMKDISQ